jgi:hypothetical protein
MIGKERLFSTFSAALDLQLSVGEGVLIVIITGLVVCT